MSDIPRYRPVANDKYGITDDVDGKLCEYRNYARLKAEVERLKLDAYKKLSMRIEIDKLKARIEYLTNAGDVMADAINGDYNHELPCVKAWNAAKDGKPSV